MQLLKNDRFWPWILAAGGVAFGAAAWNARVDETSALAARVTSLSTRIDAMARDIEAMRQASAPRRESRSFPRTDGIRGAPATQRPSAPTRASLQVAHQREPVDAAWAAATEHRLELAGRTEAILAFEADPPASRRIDCRSETCRLEFTFDDEADATDWTTAYLTGVGGVLSTSVHFVEPQPDGSVRVTMFGHR
ncbi:hypothetical protein GCM10028862_18160 [Luteimonas pelagia]